MGAGLVVLLFRSLQFGQGLVDKLQLYAGVFVDVVLVGEDVRQILAVLASSFL